MSTQLRKPDVIVICGPTGAGKTTAAIEIAQAFHGEIVGADSMQIYRYMDIGTAKPTLAEQTLIHHHMVNIINPDEPFDASRYAKMAHAVIDNIHARGIIPIVVGGTGLYIKALLYGLFASDPSDPKIRNRLKEAALQGGIETLYERLVLCDPMAAERIHPNDTYRIIRALEVWEITGKTISEHHQTHQFSEQPLNALKIGLDIARKTLYERINHRVEVMVDMGFVDEVKRLLKRGYTADHKSMQSIGYRHITAYLHDQLELDEAIRTMKRDTRRYAKRQMTWFKADTGIIWINAADRRKMIHSATDFLYRT